MGIPRHFHFVFGLKPQKEPFHLSHYLCLASCIEVNRPERLTLYYHYEPFGHYWELIREKIELVQVDLASEVSGFDYKDRLIGEKYVYAHHADFVRIDKLIEFGGVYADIDTLFVHPIPDELFAHPVVMGIEAPLFDERTQALRQSVCNALIMAERGAPFLVNLRAQMEGALDGSWSNHSCQLIRELADRQPEEIHLEQPCSFYRFMWTVEDFALLFEGQEENLEGIFNIHLWSHLWWDRSRKDFSSFHAGKITESRIRRFDTTYNLLARPFLPAPIRRWWSLAR